MVPAPRNCLDCVAAQEGADQKGIVLEVAGGQLCPADSRQPGCEQQ